MRAWIDLMEASAHRVLYHGTKPELLPEIEAHGLDPEHDVSWREEGPGIYLTDSIELAKSYGSAILVIDLSKLDLRNMITDDHELYDAFSGDDPNGIDFESLGYSEDEIPDGMYECTWEDSLKIVQQCKYAGVIPPEAISIVKGETLHEATSLSKFWITSSGERLNVGRDGNHADEVDDEWDNVFDSGWVRCSRAGHEFNLQFDFDAITTRAISALLRLISSPLDYVNIDTLRQTEGTYTRQGFVEKMRKIVAERNSKTLIDTPVLPL